MVFLTRQLTSYNTPRAVRRDIMSAPETASPGPEPTPRAYTGISNPVLSLSSKVSLQKGLRSHQTPRIRARPSQSAVSEMPRVARHGLPSKGAAPFLLQNAGDAC
ncbi:hypothetical protein HRG_006054 [Hirsutella rhossiliensis]|uniref:Uncharacterized protein n=1 Tax=Hirsutella rhossiliensis TaxID=111463 RepID=A0A9P8SIU1_9HYPO|nr:uncharacterized protein HRG_06054 [Hirsutella rhossiliensis]KAH0963544.1 hypothetical protein HRG_06054 [Hirsutella rhossiliensis]